MKLTLKIEIDSGLNHCGKCKRRVKFWCHIFDKELEYSKILADTYRLEECKAVQQELVFCEYCESHLADYEQYKNAKSVICESCVDERLHPPKKWEKD